jgi:LysM repeat protein
MSRSRLCLSILAVVVLAALVVAPGAALAASPASAAASSGSAAVGAPSPPRFGPPPPPSGGLCTYRVRRGDTLANIAWRHFTSVSYLASINGIRNPNLIYAGQLLRVPCRTR